MSQQFSDSSSDEASDTEISNLSNLLWHKIRQRKPQAEEPATSSSSSANLSVSSSASILIEPQAESQSKRRSSQLLDTTIQKQLPKVDVGSLLASMGSTEAPKKALKQKSAYEQALEKDVKNLKSIREPCLTKWQRKKEAKLKKSQWSLGKEGWGSMRMVELTKERKDDLMVLNMRSTIDPTRHYKHGDMKTPKFFQVGEVQENSLDFYQDRIPKKKRKRTLVDELMADKDFKKRLKQQYKDVMATKSKGKALFQGRAPRKIKNKKK